MSVKLDQIWNSWYVVGKSNDFSTKPSARSVLGENLVVFRDNKGELSALRDRCSHRNVPLSSGEILPNGNLRCPYHGWEFDSKGNCSSIPGLCNYKSKSCHSVQSFCVEEKDELVWVFLGEKNKKVDNPHLASPESQFDQFILSDTIESSLINGVENFLDGFHTHYVHAGLVRSDKDRQHVQAKIKREGEVIQIEYFGEKKQNGLISRIFESERTKSVSRFVMPCTAQLEYHTKSGINFKITVYFTPTSEKCCNVYVCVETPKGKLPAWFKKMILIPFIKKAYQQDKKILKLQSENLVKAEENFRSTSLDLLYPHLKHLLRLNELGKRGSAELVEKTIDIYI